MYGRMKLTTAVATFLAGRTLPGLAPRSIQAGVRAPRRRCYFPVGIRGDCLPWRPAARRIQAPRPAKERSNQMVQPRQVWQRFFDETEPAEHCTAQMSGIPRMVFEASPSGAILSTDKRSETASSRPKMLDSGRAATRVWERASGPVPALVDCLCDSVTAIVSERLAR